MERAWDRYCIKSDDPCNSLKRQADIAIAEAEGKMENMLSDPKSLFGTGRWQTHADDLSGRIESIRAMVRLGKKIGCDMAAQEARAKDLAVPQTPRDRP